MTQIFVSYSRSDADFVEPFVQRLRRANYRVWMDRSDIKAGTNWQSAIEAAIAASSAMIVVISPDSLTSDWVRIEYTGGLNKHLQVIPYLIKGTTAADIPLALSGQHALFGDDAQAFDKLVAELPQSAHIHASRVVEDNLIGRRDLTFQEAAQDLPNALQFSVKLENQDIQLIGLPLKPTEYCTTYLVGRADDTLEWCPTAQLGIQMTQSFPGDHFPVGVAEYFITPASPEYRLRLLLVRGPLRVELLQGRETYAATYGFDPNEPGEWRDALEAVRVAVDIYSKGHNRPDLHIFSLAPGVLLYRLGEYWREYVRATLYQYVPGQKGYARVL